MEIKNNVVIDRCPLCLSNRIKSVGKLRYGGGINYSSHQITLSHVPELWKCGSCLSRFVQYTVNAETARALYSTGLPSERWSKAPFEESKTTEVIKQMAAIFRGGNNVLDVGCNTGELLDFARQFGCATCGVELSSASRDILGEKGHRFYTSLEETPGKYDVITAFDLVEHLHDVPAFLRSCREKLSVNGRLVILTGNIMSLSAFMAGSRWWYAQYPEHIVFPSKQFFIDKSGYEVEKWILTYASKGYQKPLWRRWLQMSSALLRRQVFSGLPSIGPDHVLAVLKK